MEHHSGYILVLQPYLPRFKFYIVILTGCIPSSREKSSFKKSSLLPWITSGRALPFGLKTISYDKKIFLLLKSPILHHDFKRTILIKSWQVVGELPTFSQIRLFPGDEALKNMPQDLWSLSQDREFLLILLPSVLQRKVISVRGQILSFAFKTILIKMHKVLNLMYATFQTLPN